MEVFDAKLTVQNWGELLPSRPTTLSEFFVVELRLILVIQRF